MKLCLRCNQYFNDTLEMCPKDQAPLEEVGKDPIIGALIDDRYVIDSVIGKGSSGIVYKASRLMMGGDVAVKVIHSYLGADSASLDRLLRELKAAERLRHAHVITVWDSGTTDDGQPYLVMDYCEGITLSQLITQKGALPPKRVLNVLRQVTEALAHAHEQGFIHRDMKPENIVLEESELRGDYVKVLDFGIADTPAESAQRAKFNKPKTVAGSPAYMSPEQCQGFELDYRSDLYSLAVIAFEMFTGRRPFLAHDLMKLMYMTVTEPPPKMGQVRKDLSFPDRVEAVIAKALSKLPDDRQSTIRDFWKELEQACEGLDFGKSDRVKAPPPREQQNAADLEILPSERLVDEDKPKRPQFEAGPEDMPELFMPPPPPPKSAQASDAPAAEPAKPASPPPPGGAPARGPGIASLVNKQQPPGAPAKPASPVTPGPSVSGTVKPLQPTRIGPGGAKLPAAPPKPGDPQRPPAPGGPRPPGPAGGPTGGKPPGPPGPPKAPPPPGASGSGGPRPGGGPPPSPTAAPPLPVKPPSPTPNPSNGPAMGLESSDAHSQFPDKTMSRLSALVKRPTSSMAVPSAADIASAPAKPAPAPEPAPERPPSVYSYVPPKEEKPPAEEAKTESNNNQNPNAPKGAPAKPGGPAGQAKPGGPGGPGGPRPGGPAGAKPGGPNQVRPGGAPQGAKPGAGPNPGGPSGAKPGVQNRPAGAPGGPSGAKPGEGPSGNKPGAGPTGGKPAPSGVKVAPKPGSGAPGGPGSSSPAKPAEGTKPAQSGKPEPAKAEPKSSTPSAPANKEDEDITPALARAGATWVESSAEWDSMAGGGLDGNLLDESKQAAQRRISNLDWEDEIEALKTGSVEPIVIDQGPGGELLSPQQPGAWPPGMVPPGGPNPMPGQMPPGMPPQGMPPQGMPPQGMPPGYPPQNWPPGMVPGQPMMPGYDQTMSYPPGMMHPYMQPPGYPPAGYPLPPNQDVSGAYPMMPNYPPMPPPGQDVSGQYQIPGYMPPGQGYQYGAPGMPLLPGIPGMPPHGMPGMPPQGMPPGMVPQGMPPGMVPQGMPPGMVPQGYPPGMPPQGMPPFMSPSLPDAVSGSPGGLGSALLDDLKSDFGETPQGDSLDDLFEDVPPEEAPALPKADEEKTEKAEGKKTEVEKESEPAGRNEDLAVPLDKFEKFEETDESLKQKELAAKSEAEAAELGDSLLALMDSTEKDRGSVAAEKAESKAKEPEKKAESPKSTGSRALGSLLGALTASDDDLAEPAESEESGGNAFAAAVASSASVPSLTEKSKKSGSAFGQLLAAVKEDDEDEPSDEDDDSANAGGASLPKQAISDALDDLLGPDDPSASVNRAPAMKNPFEADDDILGDGNAIVKPSDSFPTAAARLASALSQADDEPEPPYAGVDAGSIMSGAAPQNPSTSTSDALSRLLEAASKAPSKASPSESTSGGAAMSEIDKMAARVNKPPAKVSRKLASAKAESGNNPAEPQPFSGFGGGGGAFGGNYAGDQAPAYGGAPDMRSSSINSTGSNSSYSQDAVNARIAELNRKLEQQSIGRKDVELPQAPPPDPSVIGDSPNRRDVVNRIMEEAGKRHQYGADYESPEPAPSGKPTVSGSNFNPNELDKVNSSRLASMAEQEQRRKKSRSRNATMPRFPVAPVVGALAIIGLCTAGYFNQGAIKSVWDGIMSSVAPPDSSTEKKDSELLAKVNDLVAKGKLNEARKILEQEESARGLPPEWSDKLDTIYISIAKYKKNAGATPEAIKTLELIPNESSHYQDAQKLIKQYKGTKKSSSKRKRR